MNTANTAEIIDTITLDQFLELLLLPDWVRRQRVEIASRQIIRLKYNQPTKISGFMVKTSTMTGIQICYYESFSMLEGIPETLRFRTGRIPETWTVHGLNVIDKSGNIFNEHDLGMGFIPDVFSDLNYDLLDQYFNWYL